MLNPAHLTTGVASGIAAAAVYSAMAYSSFLGIAGMVSAVVAGAIGGNIPDWDLAIVRKAKVDKLNKGIGAVR